jgi:Tol biopolymer transport system component
VTVQSERLSAALSDRYRIERELGAGGMATVYLAADLKHDRRVAIKVLNPELAAVLGADRFVIEIKTTASLSHPHILPLFDSGTADGFLYYVMPFIEGETIRDALNRESQFGVEKAVRIACEVADALDYAHRHGVIHRDIKPENILLHDGRAMVMDFGIALAVSAAAGGRMTETGLSLGTPHYMSPEQATAEKEITGRSDIYSLASVLYEMLAGQPPHTGGAAQQVIMKIITERAQDVTRLRSSVPRNVAAALSKALEKLAADRFESASAFAAALRDPAFAGDSAIAGTASGTAWNRTTFAMAAVATLLAVALGWNLLTNVNDSASDPAPVRFALTDDAGLRIETGTTRPFAVSPDGRRVVFRASRDSVGPRLWVRSLDDPTPRPLDGTEDGMNSTFSPNGEWIAFISGNSQIKKVRADGGPVTPVVQSAARTAALAWSDDDFIYFEQIGPGAGIHRVAAGGGRAELAVPYDSAAREFAQRRPMILGGTGVLAYGGTVEGEEGTSIVLVRLSDGNRSRLPLRGIGALGLIDDLLVYSQADGVLMAVRVDLDALAIVGAPVPLEPRVATASTGTAVAMSSNGTLVYRPSLESDLVRLALVDTSGRVTPLDGRYMVQAPLRFSPDGQRIVIPSAVVRGTADYARSEDVQVLDLRSQISTRLRTTGAAHNPSWSADGKRVVVLGVSSGSTALIGVPLDGTAEARLAEVPLPLLGATSASRDGRFHVVTGGFSGNRAGLLRVWTDGSARVDTLLEPSPGKPTPNSPRVSPDGKLVAYLDRTTGDVYVLSLEDRGTLQVSDLPAGFGRLAVWGPDSRRLYFVSAGGLVTVRLELTPALRVLDRRTRVGFPSTVHYDLSPDGRTFVMPNPNERSANVEIALNWAQAVRRTWAEAKR